MRVCYTGIYSVAPEYPRNNNIIQGLRETGVTVDECRVELEESFTARAAVAQSFFKMALFAAKLAASYLKIILKLIRLPRPDMFVVGHPGYFHLHFIKLIRSIFFRGVPVVYDVFIPLYDAVVCDRRFFREKSLPAGILHWFEGSVCRNADLCLIDTDAHCDYMADQFKIPRDRVKKVYVGTIFLGSKYGNLVQSSPAPAEEQRFRVLHFATYIPLHGMHVTVRAAKILEGDPDIHFLVVGRGQLEAEIKSMAKDLELKNLEFKGWVPVEELYNLIAGSHVSLGIFGTTEKTKRVIPSKVFDTLAVGRPLISGDTPAMREAFTHGKNVYLVPLDDPEALAAAIRELKRNPEQRESMAKEGHSLYQELFTPESIGRQFLGVVGERFGGNFNQKDKVVK